MLLWPEQSHTSPNSTSFKVRIHPWLFTTVILYGPPALIGSSSIDQMARPAVRVPWKLEFYHTLHLKYILNSLQNQLLRACYCLFKWISYTLHVNQVHEPFGLYCATFGLLCIAWTNQVTCLKYTCMHKPLKTTC